MTITIREALQRILDSNAANEGHDARCVFHPRDGCTAISRTLRSCADKDQLVSATLFALHEDLAVRPARIVRSVRNWEIRDEYGEVIFSSFPWDDTPNVAKLGTRPDPAHIESLIQFNARVQELANEAERLRQFVIAQNLWQMAAVISDYTKQPSANAISESRRLGEVAAALLAQSQGKPTGA